MGSNISRRSDKGLSRRSQSSGNLCTVRKGGSDGLSTREKICGSLPNHLDRKNSEEDNDEVQKNNKRNMELGLQNLLPGVKPRTSEFSHDQGYGSERSPEDEERPVVKTELQNDAKSEPAIGRWKYPFITKETTFEVSLLKGSRGLGLSVTGGVETEEQWPGLIRIKRLFPHEPAWQSGKLSQGDVLLAANGIPLTGLTNYEALELLRTAPTQLVLTVCRPVGNVFCTQSPDPHKEPPPPPRREIFPPPSSQLQLPEQRPQSLVVPCGEFEATLTKVNGSLGFTLRKEDESVLGHYVRALVREPALSDGRIKPGDKIVAVNGVDISPMSHEEAVMFLRQCPEEVNLRLYRDNSQTPVSALSPTEPCKKLKARPILRKEAMDMLTDLAVKKNSPSESGGVSLGSKIRRLSDGQVSSPTSSPRRRRLTKTPSPNIHTVMEDRFGSLASKSNHFGTCNNISRESSTKLPCMDLSSAGVDKMERSISPVAESPEGDKPKRPTFLNLEGRGSRRQKYLFMNSSSVSEIEEETPHSLNQCPTDSTECNDSSILSEPSSMPTANFSYHNPAYQSANLTHNNQNAPLEVASPITSSDQDIPTKLFSQKDGTQGLLKWKGVVFTPDEEEDRTLTEDSIASQQDSLKQDMEDTEGEVFTVELSKGWNSRLGFSLQGDGNSRTYISAVYADSVAAKDGRLQAGDQVLMVNDESVEAMSTTEVIDLVRKIRGTIAITVLRKVSRSGSKHPP